MLGRILVTVTIEINRREETFETMKRNLQEEETEFIETGEDNFEETEMEESETGTAQKMKQLRDKLARCDEEKRAVLEDLQRTRADFLNSKKRLEEAKEREVERATEKHIEKLLPLCDSFSLAMSNKAAWEAIDEVWRKGIEGINNQLLSLLSSYGIQEDKPEGEIFDPNKHEAVGEVAVPEKDDGKIVSVLQSGYIIKQGSNEKILRPARVIVGHSS